MSTAAGTPARRRLRPEQRRALILAAAAEEFGRRGHREARLEDIARAAGTTKAVIYDHFESKEALHAAVLEQTARELVERFAQALATEGDEYTRMRAAWLAYFRFAVEHPHAPRLLFRDPSQGGEVERLQRRQQRLAADAGAQMLLAEPRFLAGHPDREKQAARVSHAVIGALNAIAGEPRRRGRPTPEEMTELALDLLFPGLAAMSGERWPPLD